MKKIWLGLVSALCLGLGLAATVAQAQDKYPSKPVRVLVPYAPGGATDIVARIIGDQLRQILGQNFVVENKPGAFGILAIEELARAKPDGYTLMLGNVSTNAITPLLFPKKMTANYERDVTAILRIVDVPEFLLVTTKGFSANTVKELIEAAKKNPGKVRYGTVGAGSYPHFDMAYFAKKAGNLDMIAIHNKNGASGVINDMVSGDTQAAFLNVASTAAMIKAGNLKALAIVNDKRLPEYPDVPTMQEVGLPDVGTLAWQGLFAPANTPKDILETVHKATLQAMQAPAAQEAFKKLNFRSVPSPSVDAAKAWLRDEMKNWKTITDEVKIEVTE